MELGGAALILFTAGNLGMLGARNNGRRASG